MRQSIQQQLSGIDTLYERMNDIAVEIMMRSDLKNAFKKYDGKITGNSLAQYNYIKEQLTAILVRQEGHERRRPDLARIFRRGARTERQYILSTGNAWVISRARIGDQPWFRMIQENPDTPLFLYSSHYSFSSKNVGLGEEERHHVRMFLHGHQRQPQVRHHRPDAAGAPPGKGADGFRRFHVWQPPGHRRAGQRRAL